MRGEARRRALVPLPFRTPPPLSSQGKTPQSPSQRENVGTGGSSWAKVRPSVGRVQDRTCGTQKARFVSWLQREKLGCELCWDPGPSVSPGHGHAQSTLHSEALLLLGAPCPPDSNLLSPECRSVSPRVAFLLAHRHAEFQQPRGLCTCGPSAGTPSEFLPRPGSFSYEANRKSKLQSGAPPPPCPSRGWSLGFTWVPGDQEIWVQSKKSKRQGRRARGGRGGEWKWEGEPPPPGSGPLHPPPTPACCPEGSR